jgi:hypothetical protein
MSKVIELMRVKKVRSASDLVLKLSEPSSQTTTAANGYFNETN